MSLERFRSSKIVVLKPTSTVYEAARAMADNHIGAVLVGHEHRLVGIATDRDLALRAVADDLDPRTTPLRRVMTDVVGSCDITTSVAEVVTAMRQYATRRMPITERGKPVGIVTLDDLMIERAVDLETASSVVEAQLTMPARNKPEGRVRPVRRVARTKDGLPRARQRHQARAARSYARLVRAVERYTGLAPRARAETALGVVLGMLCRRLRPEDARQVVAQLPSKLQPGLLKHLDGPRKDISTATLDAELARQLGLSAGAALDLLYGVCDALVDDLPSAAVDQLRGHLPEDMRELLSGERVEERE